MELRSWAGNIRFSTDRVHHPETVGQVQEIVHKSRQVRVLGARHSFNAIADSTGDLISLDRLQPVLEVDAQGRQITVDGGTGNDSIRGDNDNDSLLGGDGYDEFDGGQGNDTIDGGAQADTVYYSGEVGDYTITEDGVTGGSGDRRLSTLLRVA